MTAFFCFLFLYVFKNNYYFFFKLMVYPLIYSSQLFMFNSIFAYIIDEETFSYILFIAYLFSFLHHATNIHNSIYHKSDLVVSRLTTMYISLYTLRFTSFCYTFILFNNVALSYYLSNTIYTLYPNKKIWIYYHFYFHFISNICIYTILNTSYEHKLHVSL